MGKALIFDAAIRTDRLRIGDAIIAQRRSRRGIPVQWLCTDPG
jgi:hypothetical protein